MKKRVNFDEIVPLKETLKPELEKVGKITYFNKIKTTGSLNNPRAVGYETKLKLENGDYILIRKNATFFRNRIHHKWVIDLLRPDKRPYHLPYLLESKLSNQDELIKNIWDVMGEAYI